MPRISQRLYVADPRRAVPRVAWVVPGYTRLRAHGLAGDPDQVATEANAGAASCEKPGFADR